MTACEPQPALLETIMRVYATDEQPSFRQA
jgi:hypothetical protein